MRSNFSSIFLIKNLFDANHSIDFKICDKKLKLMFDALKSRLLIDHEYRTTGSNKPEF